MDASQARHAAYIVYDGACPFCSAYVKRLRLQSALGAVQLVNARDDHPVVRQLRAQGYQLDDAMALVIGEQVDVGGDCMSKLALMSTRSGLFNRVNALLFSSPAVSRAAYPLLRAGRNLSLRILGRPRIG